MKWLNSSLCQIDMHRTIYIFVSFFIAGSAAQALTVEEFIQIATERSETLIAIDRSIQALEADVRSRDLELTPKLSSELAILRDNRESFSSNRNSESRFLDVTLTKPFSTGTSLSVTVGHQAAETVSFGSQTTAEWEARLSQSLWRNGFGRSVRLRQASDQSEYWARRFQAEYQKQNTLVELENLYWELSLATKEVEIRTSNIQRSELLQKWVQDRIRRSAAESPDLLQVRALTSDRKLLLLATRNRINELRSRLQQIIPGPEIATLPINLSSLESDRLLSKLATGELQEKDPKRIDALYNKYFAEEAQTEAKRTQDSLRPLLDAYVSHGRNGIDPATNQAWNQAAGGTYTATQVGVLFSMDLDWGLQKDKRRSAELQAESLGIQAQALERASQVAWSELKRSTVNLRKQVIEARMLAEIQEKKSREEQRRYRLGRTTAFQAIAFEVDASEAQLRLYRLLAETRKAEARARLYTFQEGN